MCPTEMQQESFVIILELKWITKNSPVSCFMRREFSYRIVSSCQIWNSYYMQEITCLAWYEKNPLSITLVWGKVCFSKTCCYMVKITNVIHQIGFFQSLTNTMNHEHKMSNRNLNQKCNIEQYHFYKQTAAVNAINNK